GGRVRRLALPGSDLAGIHYLRGIDDAAAIRGALIPGARIVVVGGGWIGLEVAAAARTLGAEVTVLEAADRLCGRARPAGLGAYLKALHTGKGVNIRLGARIEAFAGSATVTGVMLAGGETIPASAVVVGVGIVPNVELAAAADLAVDNGVVVDASGRTDDPDI